MPTVFTGMKWIGDGTYTKKLNVSELIDAIDPRDIPFLSILGWGTNDGRVSAGANSLAFPCIATTHTWQNDELIPTAGTLGASYTSGGGTLTFTTGQGSYVKAGQQIMVGDVYYVVSSVSTDSVVVDLVEGSSDASHDSGAAWYNLGTMRLDGEAFSTAYKSTALSSTSNYTQIFHETVAVSGTSESIEKYGITNEFEREFSKKFQEMLIQLERAAIYGIANSEPATNATRNIVRRMGGLAHFIRDASGTITTDAAGAVLTEKMIVDNLQEIWARGGKPNMMMVGAAQQRRISSWAAPYVRTQRGEETVGVVVNTYHSDFGDIDIVLNRYMKPTDAVILTTEYLGIGPLAGNGNSRAFFMTDIPVDGDSRKAAITGEYTMEVKNNKAAHAWIENLSTTLS